jgi:hypothetical protein
LFCFFHELLKISPDRQWISWQTRISLLGTSSLIAVYLERRQDGSNEGTGQAKPVRMPVISKNIPAAMW